MGKKHRQEVHLEAGSRPRRRLLLLWLAALLALAGLSARLCFIQVVGLKNGTLVFMRYPFVEERTEHPRLQLLRRRERLDEVIAPGRSQFDKILLLRRWAHAQWRSQGQFYYPPWDAVEILDLARRQRNFGFCAQYAIVFAQACRALGLHARYVDVGHFLTEVWSDEYDHWVAMDPTNDVHYERDGQPMRGRDIADAAWQGRTRGIFLVGSDGSRRPADAGSLQEWRSFSIVTRNNHLSQPIEIERQGRLVPLTHLEDYRRYPLAGEGAIAWAGEFLAWLPPGRTATDIAKTRTSSGDPADFRNAYDQTIILVAARDERQGCLKLRFLAENAPEFSKFLVALGPGPFQEIAQDNAIIFLKPGLNTVRARLKTRFGWLGPESFIRVLYKPEFF